MFNFFKKKSNEQKALEHLAKFSHEIRKDQLGPLGAVIKFTDELKANKLHQELNLILQNDLSHPKSYYMCAALMLLSFHKSGVYDSLQNDVNIEELAKDSYVACSRIITDDELSQVMASSATNFINSRADEQQKYLTAWGNWLNNLDLLKKVFR